MGHRRPVPPPIRCRATSKRTGAPCGQYAVVGSTVCRWHGAYAGQNGRASAEELHTARRIEAVVTATVSEALAASGVPAELVQAAANGLAGPPPRADKPSADRITAEDEERAMEAAMAGLAGRIIQSFQGLALELTGAQAQMAASRPPSIPGEVVEPEPGNGAQAPAQALDRLAQADPRGGVADPRGGVADPGGQPVVPVERRPTHKRVAEHVKEHSAEVMLSMREAQTNLYGRKAVTDPPPAPPEEPEDDTWADELGEWLGVSPDAAA